MKKTLLLMFVAGLVFSLAGCDDKIDDKGGGNFDQYYTAAFRNNGQGTVTVRNNTNFDMLLFEGEFLGTDRNH